MQIQKKLMLLVGILLSFSCLAKNSSSELYYSKMIEIAEKNIRNEKTQRYVPQEVLIDPSGKVVVTPVQDPFVRVFDPESSMADRLGMIYMPRISVKTEREKIKSAKMNLGR